MRYPKASTQLLALTAMGAMTVALEGCSDEIHEPRPVLDPSTIVLRLPASLGEMNRPAVNFDHGKHTTALGEGTCKQCHSLEKDGEFDFGTIIDDADSADDAMIAYHDACITCHQDRSKSGNTTGPVTCAGCHNHQPGTTFVRANLEFDYGLHHRHNEAENGECATCHHVYDEEKGKLVYEKGAESACSDCHGQQDAGRTPSLRHAAHEDCVNCHVDRAAKGKKSGPQLCIGCHDVQQIAAIEPVKNVPRLERGQPDWTWIRAEGATAAMVPFNHADHEKVTTNCSSCHHQTLRACKDCHTLVGTAEGEFVTLERAYHHPTSTHSCVGCHQQQTEQANCAGCHHVMEQSPLDGSCQKCHTGPLANTAPDTLPEPSLPPVQLEQLPPTSQDFPAELTLEYMPGGDYGPAKLPHRLIVERLDRIARNDGLAARFHGNVETLCAGCHHHSPVGMRPPKCASCHAADNEEVRDRPGLKAAFHRQCIECHQQMDIKAGCTDCHAEASKEDKQ
ncbi:MAG: sulfate respiration complex hexadecaheme cytochrome HmcA [Myxococcota bacterium]